MEVKDSTVNSSGKCEKWKFRNITCRLCSSECQSRSKHVMQKNILEMIESCSSLRPSVTDGLPNKVCPSCFRYLTISYKFRKKVESTDVLLKNKLQSLFPKHNILDIALNEAKIKDMQSEEAPKQLLSISSTHGIEFSKFTSRGEKQPLLNIDSKDSFDCSASLEKDEEKKESHNIQNNDTAVADGKIEKVSHNISLPALVPIHPKGKSNGKISTLSIQDEPPPLVPLNPCSNKDLSSNMVLLEPPDSSYCENSAANLTKNQKELGEPSMPLFCNICKKEYKEEKKLIGHLKGHIVPKNFICKICGKKYPNLSTFQVHMRSHTGERPFKCPVCSKGFTRWAGVVSHMQTHEDNRPFKCDSCDQSFKIMSNLERHKVLHAGVLPFCCNYCGKTFSQSANLKLHIRTYHTNERPYLCSECGKGFVSSTRLNRHMWVHTGYKPFHCKICSKAYSNSGDLKNHESGAHGSGESEKLFACNLCDKRFLYSCRLNKHLKTHQRPHACNQCSETFRSRCILDQHIESKHSISFSSSNESRADIFEESK